MPATRRRPPPPAVSQSLRLFFALWPDGRVRGELDAWAAAMHAECGGRRVGADKLHVTLAFLGMLPLTRVADLSDISLAIDTPPFELLFDKPGYWNHNDIAWLGTSTVPLALTALAEALRARLSSANLPFDRKPYVPHVTLVRDAGRPRQVPALPPVAWSISSFALVQSWGGRYTVLSTYPLRGDPQD
jgi:RNA 2',3'-cyclic 3'-phosphodiesterase